MQDEKWVYDVIKAWHHKLAKNVYFYLLFDLLFDDSFSTCNQNICSSNLIRQLHTVRIISGNRKLECCQFGKHFS